ncbi:MAG: hypothetical protein R2795_06370 [Saprospiraceae bacterium]
MQEKRNRSLLMVGIGLMLVASGVLYDMYRLAAQDSLWGYRPLYY